MHRYLVVIEPTGTGSAAFSPDVPGCVAAGATREAVESRMQEALAMHLEAVREDGVAMPAPGASATHVDVAA